MIDEENNDNDGSKKAMHKANEMSKVVWKGVEAAPSSNDASTGSKGPEVSPASDMVRHILHNLLL